MKADTSARLAESDGRQMAAMPPYAIQAAEVEESHSPPAGSPTYARTTAPAKPPYATGLGDVAAVSPPSPTTAPWLPVDGTPAPASRPAVVVSTPYASGGAWR